MIWRRWRPWTWRPCGSCPRAPTPQCSSAAWPSWWNRCSPGGGISRPACTWPSGETGGAFKCALGAADDPLVSDLHLGDDPQVRAMVALVEAQAAQITSLRDAVTALEGRLAIRGALDNVVLDSVRVPMDDLLRSLKVL